MLKNKPYLKPLLWMIAFTLPWGLGGFIVHTAFSLSAGMILYWVAGLLAPFIFYLVQKEGWGSEGGAARAAAHLAVWPSLVLVEMVAFWKYLPAIDRAWKTMPVPTGLAALVVLSLFIIFSAVLDKKLVELYEGLKEKGGLWSLWLGCSFFTGLIPGTAMISFLWLYYTGGMRLDPFTASFFLLEIFSVVFYGKIFIGMMTFGIFLFLALKGAKAHRIVQSVFTAIFWLFFLFIPMVISLRLTGGGSWRAYMDPSYLSVFPYLSDLWLTGLALMGAEKLTGWIFKA